MKRSRIARVLAAALLALGASTAAHAEVWGYVDARGVAHFATEKVDERYELFFRGGESFDTSRGIATPRAVAVPTAQPKLIAFFQVSPSFKQVKHHLREASQQNGVDYELLQALIATESGFDAQAVSPKGAIGLMQVLPATAERYGVVGDKTTPAVKKLADPRTNIRTGTRHLRDLITLFSGRLELALAAYNAGEGAVQRAGNRIPNYPETQKYVKTVMQIYNMLKPPSALTGVPLGRLGGGLGGGTAVMGAGRAPQRIRMELPAPKGGA
ncbi:lytic transglycosylase domain-containing protein, partial [Ramlibacter sp.]|uniref:lytic transglycosylase domain-containing protein n=1 Tax=Ramlibacter sp. TaxID=1917967 RepID=UPI0017BB24F1